MKRERATQEARKIANRDRLRMVVAFNPYADEPDEAERFSYFPERSLEIFQYEEVVETIEPAYR